MDQVRRDRRLDRLGLTLLAVLWIAALSWWGGCAFAFLMGADELAWTVGAGSSVITVVVLAVTPVLWHAHYKRPAAAGSCYVIRGYCSCPSPQHPRTELEAGEQR